MKTKLLHQILITENNKLPTTFPRMLERSSNSLKKVYPDCNYRLYSGEELESIIEDNFDSEVFKSYLSLKPFAYKSDLARYCLLHLYGGLYSDISMLFKKRLPFLDQVNFFAFRDASSSSYFEWSVYNGLIYSMPNNIIMENAIRIIIHNCKNKNYGYSPICVTGPIVLGQAIMASGEQNRIFPGETKQYKKYQMGMYLDREEKPIVIGMKKIKLLELLGFEGTNDYRVMYYDRDVFDPHVIF